MPNIDNKSLLLFGSLGSALNNGTTVGQMSQFPIDTGIYKWDIQNGLTFVPRVLFTVSTTPISVFISEIGEADENVSGNYTPINENRLTRPYAESTNVYTANTLDPYLYLNGIGVIGELKRYLQIKFTFNTAVTEDVYYGVDMFITPSLFPVDVDYYNSEITPLPSGFYEERLINGIS